MGYNDDAQVFEKQIVIENISQQAGVTSGSIVNKGTLSTLDTYITGHTIVNNVKITPNLNDIIFEQQSTLANNQASFTNITDFSFDNSTTTSFKAIINVTVSTGQSKYAVWEINGLYKPSGWVITSSFTGDLTGITFSIANEGGIGHMQYKNSNTSGTTTIRYRATTTAQPGSTPIGVSGGVISNTSGPFLANNLIYASTDKTLATTDITYNSNLFTIGGASRLVGENSTNFVSFSNGGAITSMGDASVAKRMIIGEKVGIATTAPSYALDVVGDINFTGTFYKNKNIYSGSEIWNTNGTSVFYTTGNIGLGTTNPTHQLDVVGGIRSTSLSSGSISTTNIISTNSTIGTFAALGGTIGGNVIPSADITYSLGSSTNRWKDIWLASGTLYLGDKPLSLTGDTFTLEKISVTSTVDSSSVTTGALLVSGGAGINGKIYSTEIHSLSGTVGSFVTSTVDASTITAASIQVTNVNATTVTASTLLNTNAVSTNVTASTLNLTTGLTSASALITNVVATNISTGTLQAPSGITVGNINFTGSLYQNGVPYLGSQWTSTAGNVSYTSGSVSATNISSTNITVGTILANTITGGTLSLSGDLIVGGTLTTVNITTTNVVDTNISTGTLYVSSTVNVGTSISSGIVAATNIVATSLTSGSILASNANITNISAGVLITSTINASGLSALANATATNVSTGGFNASGLSALANVTATNVSTGSLNASGLSVLVNATATNVSTGGLNASGLSALANATATNISTGGLNASGLSAFINATATNVSTGGLNASGLSALANVTATNISVGSLIAFTSVSSGMLAATNATVTNIVTTVLTAGALKTSDISLDGNLIATGDITAFGSLSDRRLKTNIIDIDAESALNTVKSLRPVTFDWRDDIFNESKRGSHDVGFIAQEVEEIVPQAVAEYKEMNSGTFYKNIKHERLIPYLVGAIQKLQVRIEQLENKL